MISIKACYFILYIVIFFALLVPIEGRNGGDSQDRCLSNGFNSLILQCNTCDHVAEILGDSSSAYLNCKSCCHAETVKAQEKFKKAVLEVDKRSLPFAPDLQAVVDMKKQLKIQVRNRYGSARLLMFREIGEDEPSEVLSVHSWTKDTFVDYFKTHLVQV